MSESSRNNFTFKHLNFWRKIFLILLWLVNLPISLLLISLSFYKLDTAPVALTALTALAILGIFNFLFVVWVHIAIVNRSLTQLKWIAFFMIIPFVNPLGLLIMLSIIRVTKIELQGKSS